MESNVDFVWGRCKASENVSFFSLGQIPTHSQVYKKYVNDAFAANIAWGELFDEGSGPLTLGATTGDVSQMNLSSIHALNLTKLTSTDASAPTARGKGSKDKETDKDSGFSTKRYHLSLPIALILRLDFKRTRTEGLTNKMRPPRSDKRSDKGDGKSDKGHTHKTEFHQKLEVLQKGSAYDGKEKYAVFPFVSITDG
jgi:hypothetical protein